ncbi:MAG: 3-phosphoshikimate 1-carboxyvinyltransferase [Deltaproteobacteria bacterium]|nr:3-phosphoshikimate 1-carboxyvinyltransferase [Deltaproteobacteria bacterium]
MSSSGITFQPVDRIEGQIAVPGDKSISHRALIFSAIASGVSRIEHLLVADDTMSSVRCLRMLGAVIEMEGSTAVIKGSGIDGFKEPDDVMDAGNSGTTARIMLGLLSTQGFFSVLTGDESLRTRPMKRMTIPLAAMGSALDGREHANYLPISVRGGRLKGIDYKMPVPSAQVKTGLIVASMNARGTMTITEPVGTRDHTERMLKAGGVDLKTSERTIRLACSQKPLPINMSIPGDFSSAAFFIGAGIIARHSDVLVTNVGINPGRTGMLDVLKGMGASVDIMNARYEAGEPVADIHVTASKLHGITVEDKRTIVSAIDELPLIAVLAAYAQGRTVVRNAEELRVKESDRIKAVVEGLNHLGVRARDLGDGFQVEGGRVMGGRVSSYGDHRIAMAFAVSSVSSEKETSIDDFGAVSISFPEFMNIFDRVRGV